MEVFITLVTNSPESNFSQEEGIIVENAFSHLPPEQCLPNEMILHIFSFLLPEDLGRASCVSRKWYHLANAAWEKLDPKKLFPSLKIIDRTVWERCVDLNAFGLSFEDVEPFDNRKLIPALKRHFDDVKAKVKVENNAGWTLVEQPKGLNLNKLVRLGARPKQGNITEFRNIYRPISDELGESAVKETYRFIITNSVLEKSRRLNFDAQKKYTEIVECEMPGVLEAGSLVVLTHMNSSPKPATLLYSDKPLTYTRCHERVNYDYPVMVGTGSPNNVHFLVEHNTSFIDEKIGVGAVRKFYTNTT